MAWGLVEPSSSGIYFPSGDYVGWDEKMAAHFVCVAPEEVAADLKREGEDVFIYFAAVKSGSWASNKFRYGHARAEPFEQPSEFRTEKSYDVLPSLVHLNDGLNAVDEPLRELIEEFEPGVHQFWPLKITMPRSRAYPVPYYGMIVLQKRDSLVVEKSELRERPPIYYGLTDSKKDFRKVCLSKDVIGSAHFWREKSLQSPDLFISDALQAAIAARELKIWRHYQVTEA